jgi:putative cell wall-binding protein
MKFKKIALCCAILAVLNSSQSIFAADNQNLTTQRLQGADRFETAANVSKAGWENGSDYAVIVNGETFPDALCSVPLAKKYNAPLLLTSKNSLSQAAKAELERLKVKHVIIVGGEGVVSKSIEEGVLGSSKIKPDFKRIWGNDRFETSVKVAEEIGTSDKIVLTNGYNYADALSVSPIAAEKEMPILLTDNNVLPDSVKNFVAEKKPSNFYIIGLEGAVSKNVEDSLNKIISSPSIRIGGSDRFATNISILKQFEKEVNFDNVLLVTGDGPAGDEFADALSGASLAAQKNAAMILTYKTLPSAAENYLKDKVKSNSSIVSVGGESVLPNSINETLAKDISNQNGNNNQNQGNSSSGSSSSGGSSSGGSSGTNSKYTLSINGQTVTIVCKDTTLQQEPVTIKVRSKGTNNYKYINESRLTNGSCTITFTLDSGYYAGELTINGIIVNLNEFKIN